MQLGNSRYERQQNPLLDQAALARASVLVIGAGGVGSPLLLYLAGAGIGQLIIADGDTVGLNNLHRQVLYREADIGKSKAECAKRELMALNSTIKITTLGHLGDLAAYEAANFEKLSMIIDCSDNAESMTLASSFALGRGVPFMAGSAEGFEGLAMYFDYSDANYIKQFGGLCCLGYTKRVAKSVPFILGPAAGLIGTTLALEAIKLLGGYESQLYGQMLRLRNGSWKTLSLCADENCGLHRI